MNKLKCECCGAPLRPAMNRTGLYVCEYCGMRYEEKSPDIPPIRIETFTNPIKTLCVKQAVDDNLLRNVGEDVIAEVTMKDITHKLAESLADCIHMEKEYDPMTMRHIITARVRVVEADYRF